MIRFRQPVQLARLQAIAQGFATGSNPSVLRLYGGTPPDPGAAVTDQPLLATIPLPLNPATVDEVNSWLDLAVPAPIQASGDGVVTWGRFLDGDAAWLADGDAGATGSAAFLQLDDPQVYAGGYLVVVSGRITEP